jgi:integrase/recombinase XerD
MRPRRFGSVFRNELEAYLLFKRALGYRYNRHEATLRRFDRYAQGMCHRMPDRAGFRALIESWLTQTRPRAVNTIANDLQVIRHFCLYRRRYDLKGFVPDKRGFFPASQSRFVPHIYSHTEIRRLLRYLSEYRGSRLQRLMGRLLLLVLYCTGLRAGEAARLCIQDLDLKRRLLWIYNSKGRTRLVPFGSDLAALFAESLRLRKPGLLKPTDPLLLSHFRKRYSRPLVSETVRRWLREAGLKPSHGRQGPRCHDLRHTFAVHRLSRWCEQRIDPNERLPWLSTYMGHANVLGTEVYLHTTPELLALAGRRFETRFLNRHSRG